MAGLKVNWTKQAVEDLEIAYQYIEHESPKSAKIVLSRLLEGIEQIRLYPKSGREGRVAGTLELVISKTPYILIYRYIEAAKKKEIQILSFLHTSRRWP